MTDTRETLKMYADLKMEEARIAKEIDLLKPAVKEAITTIGSDKVESDFGTFTLYPVSVWKYSPAVEKLEKQVDALKAEEKATGKAEATPRYDLKFSAPKKK